MRWMVNATTRRLYPRERPGTHCIGGSMGSRAAWTGAENLASTGIRSPDRPVRSESLYRLIYPGSMILTGQNRSIRKKPCPSGIPVSYVSHALPIPYSFNLSNSTIPAALSGCPLCPFTYIFSTALLSNAPSNSTEGYDEVILKSTSNKTVAQLRKWRSVV
jgi:hypothetical protein